MVEAQPKKVLKIISAVELTPSQKNSALKKARADFGDFEDVNFEQDPKILGGLVFRSPDKILDLSVAEELNHIRKLIEE